MRLGTRVSELTLFVFRIAFLVALWVFVFFVVYAVRSDLFGSRVRRLTSPARMTASPDASAFLTQAHAALPPPAGRVMATGSSLMLVITGGPKQGERIPLGPDGVTVGRSNDAGLVIRDDYTSTRHASIENRHGEWVLRDLDSTNGTFLDGKPVKSPTLIPLNTPISIGQTTFEIQA